MQQQPNQKYVYPLEHYANIKRHIIKSPDDLKGLLITSHLLIIVTQIFFTIWFVLEVNIRKSNDATPLWFQLYLYHAILLFLYIIFGCCYRHMVKHTPMGTPLRAMYNYPRYIWEVWTWFSINGLSFAYTLTITIIFCVNVGIHFTPDFVSPNPLIILQSFGWRFINFVFMSISYLNCYLAIDALFSIVCKMFPLRTAYDMISKISASELIYVSPVPWSR